MAYLGENLNKNQNKQKKQFFGTIKEGITNERG